MMQQTDGNIGQATT